jgi:phage-related protein
MGVQLTIQLGKGLIRAIPQIVAQLPQIIFSIVSGLTKGIPSIFEVGKNIARGLWEGIASMIGWLGDNVKNMVNGIVGGVKKALGINSPSKVFAAIGANMSEGIGEGFINAMSGIEKDIQSAIPTVFNLDTRLNIDDSLQGFNFNRDMTSIVQHTGVIEVRGINTKNELTGVVEIIMDQFRREARI